MSSTNFDRAENDISSAVKSEENASAPAYQEEAKTQEETKEDKPTAQSQGVNLIQQIKRIGFVPLDGQFDEITKFFEKAGKLEEFDKTAAIANRNAEIKNAS